MRARSLLIAIAATQLLHLAAHAQQQSGEMVPGHIRAVKVEGTVWQVLKSNGQKERLKEGDFLRQGNAIRTEANGRAILLFQNGSTINLQPDTKFSIDQFMLDPFDSERVDYRKLRSEPSQSATKVRIDEGTIYFDIPKLTKTSSYNISNPVGTAGIRGTAGFVAQDSMGVTEGLVQVQTQTGQSQSLGAGQSTGFTPQGNFGPPPGNSNQNMQGAQNNSQNLPQNIPSEAFSGAGQSQTSTQGNLTQQQQEAIEQAAQQGEEALIQAVEQIANSSPESAAAAAAAAATLLPDAAPQIASAAAAAVPQNQAASLAPGIAAAVAGVVPSQAPQIAQSVAQVAPSQAGNIASAVTNAAPGADSAAVNQAAQQGAQQGNQGNNQGGGGGSSGSGGGAPPALPGGFGGGGGGGGGGSSGGGGIYSR